MGTGRLCTGKKAPIYGHGDSLHSHKGPCIGIGTLSTGNNAPINEHGIP